MRQAIEKWNTPFYRERYQSAGLSDKRFRWDLANAAGLIPFFCDTLYQYMNDEHIDTALRSIVKPLAEGEQNERATIS